MSNRGSILFLLLVILVLAFANVAIRHVRPDAGPLARRTLVARVGRPARLVLDRAGGGSVVLQRDGAWRIVAPYRGSVEEPVVKKLLDALIFTPVSEMIADSELLKLGRTRADFSLAEPVLRVTVADDAGADTISFGAPTPSADGVYAAVDGVDAVFIVPSEVFAAADVQADGFRRRSIFSLGAGAVASFDIRHGVGSTLIFTHDKDGWTVGGERASEQKVRSFISDLSAANAVDFIWPVGASNETAEASAALLAGYGLEPESAVTVTLKGVDGTDRRVSFGKTAAEGQVYALIQNGSAIVTVPSALRDAAVQDSVMFTDSRLFPVDLKSVSFFSVTDGETVYALSRDAKGAWSLESPIVAPAEASAVETLLGRILALSPSDTQRARAGVSVSLTTNVAPVTVSRETVLDKLGFESLRSREMLRIDPAVVKRLVRTPGGTDTAAPAAVVYGRDRRAWSLEAAGDGKAPTGKVDEKGIAAVLAALNPLVAARVEKLKVPAADLDDYGLDHPFLTLAIDQDREDAVRRNLLIGSKTEGGRFATVGSAEAVFVIPDAVVRALSSPLIDRESL